MIRLKDFILEAESSNTTPQQVQHKIWLTDKSGLAARNSQGQVEHFNSGNMGSDIINAAKWVKGSEFGVDINFAYSNMSARDKSKVQSLYKKSLRATKKDLISPEKPDGFFKSLGNAFIDGMARGKKKRVGGGHKFGGGGGFSGGGAGGNF